MKFTKEQQEKLKGYMLKKLDNVVDTDPEMLADYVIVLLKHDKETSVLEEDLRREVAYFLPKDCSNFCDALFREITNITTPVGERKSNAFENTPSSTPNKQGAPVSTSAAVSSTGWGTAASAPTKDVRMEEINYGDDRDWSSANRKRSYDYTSNSRDDYKRRDYSSDRKRRSDYYDDEDRHPSRETADDSNNNKSKRYRQDGNRERRDSYGGHNRRFSDQNKKRRPLEPSKKLQMFNIPEEHCTEDSVKEFFEKFGKVVGVVVYPLESRAIVEFATLSESSAAHGSTEAPFNNRFVKIFWAYDGSKSQEDLTTPKKELTEAERLQKIQESQSLSQKLAAQAEELQRKQEQQRQELIANMAHLSEADREEILKSLRNVTQTIVGAQTTHSITSKVLKDQQQPLDLLEKVKSASASAMSKKEKKEELQKKLDAVKAEHTALGLGRGGYAGRGRGRGSWASGPQRSFSLDMRPRQLKITGFSNEVKLSLRSHLDQFGHIENFVWSPDGTFAIVKYSQRWEAEQAMRRGTFVEGESTSSLKFEWNTDKLPETFVKSSVHDASDFQMDLEDDDEK